MTDKELRKLTRAELLELLLVQSRELNQLTTEVETLKQQLQQKEIILKEAGNIAEASLQLSGIFEAAQAAADLYLESVRTPNKLLEETQMQCDEMLRTTQTQVHQVWEVVRQEIFNPKLDYNHWQKIADYIDKKLTQS